MDTSKKVTLKKVKQTRNFILDLFREYSDDLSPRYKDSLSDVQTLLRDIQQDLEERS